LPINVCVNIKSGILTKNKGISQAIKIYNKLVAVNSNPNIYIKSRVTYRFYYYEFYQKKTYFLRKKQICSQMRLLGSIALSLAAARNIRDADFKPDTDHVDGVCKEKGPGAYPYSPTSMYLTLKLAGKISSF